MTCGRSSGSANFLDDPLGGRVGEGTHQRVPSPTFRVMTPTVVGKTGAAYLRLPQTTGSSPLAWGTIATGTDTRVIPTVVGKMGKVFPPDFCTRLIPTRVGKIVGVVAGEGHGFDGSTPLLGLGLSSSRKVWWGAGFRGPYPDGPQTPTGPETPAAAPVGARGNDAGSGG